MMDNLSVIKASFADIQNIKSRSVMVLKIEVPSEMAKKALDTLGYPLPGEEIPVAVARLSEEAKNGGTVSENRFATESESSSSDKGCDKAGQSNKQKWDEMPYPKRAAILSQNTSFSAFLKGADLGLDDLNITIANHDSGVAQAIRDYCRVESRSHIKPDTEAAKRFDDLYQAFYLWERYGDIGERV